MTRLRLVYNIWLITSLALLIWTATSASYFFESSAGMRAFAWPSFIVAAAIAICVPRVVADSTPSATLKYVILPVMLAYIMGYLPVAWSVPALLNRALGTKDVRLYHVSRLERVQTRRGYCNYVYITESTDEGPPRICVSYAAFQALKAEDPIQVEGPQSWLGFEIREYAVNAQPPQKVQ
jgi:hypothetical protein